ncbi:hypothetical protein GGX14DRAFT_404666 [Mycena pura]|uniref:Uncharacterized protein n=1 Tax=Mycena pura TaxID=153505 RepID=A0AAD6UTB5_9AGAR|nr:hypothetical protein GGX14DRAFT_404666 [Mycena pura]
MAERFPTSAGPSLALLIAFHLKRRAPASSKSRTSELSLEHANKATKHGPLVVEGDGELEARRPQKQRKGGDRYFQVQCDTTKPETYKGGWMAARHQRPDDVGGLRGSLSEKSIIPIECFVLEDTLRDGICKVTALIGATQAVGATEYVCGKAPEKRRLAVLEWRARPFVEVVVASRRRKAVRDAGRCVSNSTEAGFQDAPKRFESTYIKLASPL